MKITDYEKHAASTAVYPDNSAYPYLGLIEEVGEVAGILAKAERDNKGVLDDARREQLETELGDVLWMIAAVARAAGGSLAAELERDGFRGFSLAPVEPDEVLLAQLAKYAGTLLSDCADGVSGGWQLLIVSGALVLWEKLCAQFGFEPAEVAAANLAKLASRAERGKLQGEGDDR